MSDDLIHFLNEFERPAPPSVAPPKPASPFSDLPPLMKTIIDKEISAEINLAIERKHHLNPKQGNQMMEDIRKILFRTITPSELLTAVQRDLKLDTKPATDLTIDLLGRRFLPMEWYIGDVQTILRRLGGPVEEYLSEAKKNYPEVYARPEPGVAAGDEEHPLMELFDQRIVTLAGKAEILLRLTGLSSVVEERMNQDKLPRKDGEEIMRQLESVSYAINTRDLNPFEVQAIKRNLKRTIDQIDSLKT